MGSCISKCRPKKHFIEEFSHVQDKLVISQAPRLIPPISASNKISPCPHPPPISASNKISPCPQSPSNSTSSASSFTCTTSTSNTSNSLSSTLSSASSVLSSKIDRSFSNEFLWSCYKENPHVIRINSIKEASFKSSSLPQKPAFPTAVNKKQPNLKRANGSLTPQKRVSSSSPTTITRQKSFRKEPERPMVSAYSHPCRTLRSPSPSRRFNTANPPRELSHSKPNALNCRPAGLNYSNSSRLLRPNCLKSRETETRIHRISSKIDEDAVGEALADYMDSLPAEDIDNPLISLDCFIFL